MAFAAKASDICTRHCFHDLPHHRYENTQPSSGAPVASHARSSRERCCSSRSAFRLRSRSRSAASWRRSCAGTLLKLQAPSCSTWRAVMAVMPGGRIPRQVLDKSRARIDVSCRICRAQGPHSHDHRQGMLLIIDRAHLCSGHVEYLFLPGTRRLLSPMEDASRCHTKRSTPTQNLSTWHEASPKHAPLFLHPGATDQHGNPKSFSIRFLASP